MGPARDHPAGGCAELSPLSPLTRPQRQRGPSGSFHGPGERPVGSLCPSFAAKGTL